jgi:uncharacterized membrane protein YjgN (DUF898 family)
MTDQLQNVVPPPLLQSVPAGPQRLSFTGSGSEYFKIWMVNLLLTVVTLGIYSAWAKVRRLEYFYRNTRLSGAGFDYHGKPLAILKGRIIAALLFGGYYAAGLISPEASIAAFIVLTLLLPFLIVRSLRFRLYNSSYRGLRFAFAGKTAPAYRLFLGLGSAAILSLFTLGPLWHQRLKRYIHSNSLYGRMPFTFDAPVGGFYRVYLIAYGAPTTVLVVAGFLATRTTTETPSVWIQLLPIGFLLGSVCVWAFMRAHIQNLVWNHTRLGPHRFTSELRAGTLMFITITNLLGMVLTLGLYKPFAEVRLIKYVASAFALVPAGSLDEFLAGESQPVGAAGDEAVDMFDVEIAF